MKIPPPADVIRHLQNEILSLQGGGSNPAGTRRIQVGLEPVEKAFPDHRFPTGGIHEFVSTAPEGAAATHGFIAGLLCAFMQASGSCLWISTRRTIFPPALRAFGISPERIIFIDTAREKEALWTMEEALKCNSLAAVVGELGELGFTESRRLQLAVEESRVTGFIHRCRPRVEHSTASVARWKISPLSSKPEDGLPGIGYPRWKVQLLKARSGRPGIWQVEWRPDGFRAIPFFTHSVSKQATSKTG